MGRQNCVRNPTYTHTYPPPQQVQCPTPGAFPLTAVKDPRMVQSYMGKGTDFYEGAACVRVFVGRWGFVGWMDGRVGTID